MNFAWLAEVKASRPSGNTALYIALPRLSDFVCESSSSGFGFRKVLYRFCYRKVLGDYFPPRNCVRTSEKDTRIRGKPYCRNSYKRRSRNKSSVYVTQGVIAFCL